MTVFWVIVLIALAWFFTSVVRRGGGAKEDTPEEILRRRYARGEIDRETFQRMMDDVTGGRRAA